MVEPPRRALWEITWRCDLRCRHCLVNGGPEPRTELDTETALDLVDQLADLGVRIVSLTGGEPLVRRDWPILARRIRDRRMALRLSTNGHLLDDAALAEVLDLGVEKIAVSLDGCKATHDRLRRSTSGGGPSSFDRVLAVIDRLRPTPIVTEVITTVLRDNLAELPALHELLVARGVDLWTVQLAHRTGRLADRAGDADLERPALLSPDELPALERFVVDAARHPRLAPRAHNSIGYLGKAEPLLRSAGHRAAPPRFWKGCRCGIDRIGIEPDGGIKGCASQVGAPFVVGRVPPESLRAVWEDRGRWHWLAPAAPSGPCAGCALFAVCGAGCKALALGSTGSLFGTTHCLRRLERETA